MRWIVLLLLMYWVCQALGQIIFEIKDLVPQWDSVEARLTLDCRPLTKDDIQFNIPLCYASLKNDMPEFMMRTGGTHRFIGGISWKQEDIQALPQNHPKTSTTSYAGPFGSGTGSIVNTGVWVHGVYNSETGCDTRVDVVGEYCRNLRVCRMQEEVWGKLDSSTMWHMYNYAANIQNRDKLAPKTTEKCLVCPVMACDAYSCPNGKVNVAPIPTYNGLVITKPQCSKACSAGTFLTCRTDAACEYQVMTDLNAKNGDAGARDWYSANVYNLKTNVNVPLLSEAGPPVGECYPCYLARDRSHYGRVASTEDTFYDQGFLKFVCPGGGDAPVRCAANEVARFSAERKTSTGCKCQPGFFREGDRCVPCTAGFYCAWNAADEPVRLPCPTDKYSLSGASVCVDCDTNTNCGAGLALTRCKQSQGGEAPGAFQSRNARCVSCEACQQLGGDTPCYRVSPMIAGI